MQEPIEPSNRQAPTQLFSNTTLEVTVAPTCAHSTDNAASVPFLASFAITIDTAVT